MSSLASMRYHCSEPVLLQLGPTFLYMPSWGLGSTWKYGVCCPLPTYQCMRMCCITSLFGSGAKQVSVYSPSWTSAHAGMAKKGVVKQEKDSTAGSLCVKGLEGKQLSNAVSYKLKSAPEWIKLYWDNKIKYEKGSRSEEKKNCIEAILSDDGWDNPFFQRIRNLNKVDEDKTEATWMSWKKLLENEDEAVAKLMISQQKILTRPHANLDPDAEETKSLPEQLRFQYKYVVESEKEAIENTEGFHKHTDGLPSESAATEEDSGQNLKVVMASIRKARAHWNNNKIDMECRLATFKGN
eukprot:560005-Pyramimonas_sp.AAC.1